MFLVNEEIVRLLMKRSEEIKGYRPQWVWRPKDTRNRSARPEAVVGRQAKGLYDRQPLNFLVGPGNEQSRRQGSVHKLHSNNDLALTTS